MIKLCRSIKGNIIRILFFAFTFSENALAEQKIDFLETTGRAIIVDQNSISEARRNSLEDAIFLASIQGGAKIDGFSSVDSLTNLSDHFTVRPVSELLDFNIVSETIEGEHYKTVIRAAVGRLPGTKCSARSIINIVKFAGEYDFSSTVPSWLRGTAKDVERTIGELLRNNKKLSFSDVSPSKLEINTLINSSDDFDYTALTRGRIRVRSGDFAIVPSIAMKLTSSKKNIETENFLNFELKTKLFSGGDYQLVEDSNYRLIIKIKSKSPWRTFDILTRKTRDQIRLSILSGLQEHISELLTKVECIPLTAIAKVNGGKLIVDLGATHGISTNSLAVSSGVNTPYSILYVKETNERETILEPLNKSIEISSLEGKTIKFMESHE